MENERLDYSKKYAIDIYFDKIERQTKIGRCLGPKPVYRCDLRRINSEIRQFFNSGFLGV